MLFRSEQGERWPLIFPASRIAGDEATIVREWPGEPAAVSCRILREMPARELWDILLRASYDTGEPGVLFVNRINELNNLSYCERITATDPAARFPCRPMAPAIWAQST